VNLATILPYAALGAVAAAFLGRGRKRGKWQKGAMLGALAAVAAPRLGIALPALPALGVGAKA
jgi:hypothetical protein